jgi:succinoglycan biosynthesis protein ExoO
VAPSGKKISIESLNKQHGRPPEVSVVMPVYNGARTLMESVDSVLKQTYRDFELIICNDASTDETGDILDSIRDDRVRVLHNPVNSGQGLSRDRAIESARGAWAAVIDADDAWAPERLEVLLKEADAPSKIIFDDIWECHDTPSGMIPWRVMRGKRAFSGNGKDAVEVPTADFVCEKRLLIKPLFPVEIVRRHRISHGSRPFAEDTEFFLTLLAHGLQIRYVPGAMYYYRITPGSMSGQVKRPGLMREVLENAVSQFEHAPYVQNALREKIAGIIRDEYYTSFILALRRKEVIKTLRFAYQFPWVIPKLFSFMPERAGYHIHRILHGGRVRGTR